jgi:translation initiation factor IF-2
LDPATFPTFETLKISNISADPIIFYSTFGDKIIGSAEILEIFKVSKVGKVAGSKVIEGEILQDLNARIIRDGAIIFNGKIGSIFREKIQAKQVSVGLECGITIKDFNDYQKKDIIEVYNSTVTERRI